MPLSGPPGAAGQLSQKAALFEKSAQKLLVRFARNRAANGQQARPAVLANPRRLKHGRVVGHSGSVQVMV